MKLPMILAAASVFAISALTPSVLAQDGKPAAKPDVKADSKAEGKGLKLDTIQVSPANPAAPVEAVKAVASMAKHEPVWTNAETKKIGEMLSGSWKTSVPAKVAGSDQAFDVIIGIAPVYINGMADVLYVEQARSDSLNHPYRHVFWHLKQVNGQWRMQTLEFRRVKGQMPSLVGVWASPDSIPQSLSMDDLVATVEIPLTAAGAGYSGKTAMPFPTTIGGAAEMTSAISFDGKKIETDDRGMDGAGKQVWGPDTGKTYTFNKADVGVKVNKLDSGVVVITYPSTLTGAPAKDGEQVTVNYAGYLENGTVFDSSYERNMPFPYIKGGRMLEGWTQAMTDVQAGMKRRLIIPGALGYGERGSKNGKVGPNATLIVDIDVLKVEPAPAPPPPPATAVPIPDPKTNGTTTVNQTEPPADIKKKMEEDIARRMAEKQKKAQEAADKAAAPVAPGGPK